jgi:hypothetical protein
MPVTNFSTPEKYTYLNGFDSYHEYVDASLPAESS